MSEKRKYRTFTPEQKAGIVLAGSPGDRSVRDVCREYEVSEALLYQWRDRLLEGGKGCPGYAAGQEAARGRGAGRAQEED